MVKLLAERAHLTPTRKSPPRISSIYPEKITFQINALEFALNRSFEAFRQKNEWHGPLGVFAGLAATYLCTTFTNKWGLTAAEWSMLFALVVFLSLAWVAWSFARSRKVPSVEQMVLDVCRDCEALPREVTALVVRGRDRSGNTHLLVFFEPHWRCWFLQNTKLPADVPNADTHVRNFAASVFGVPPRTVTATRFHNMEFSERKPSQVTHDMRRYHYTFYFLEMSDDLKGQLREPTFTIQGRKYAWMTIEELQEHPETRLLNNGFNTYIRDNFHQFLDPGLPPSFARPVMVERNAAR